jgi:hypothetical protein
MQRPVRLRWIVLTILTVWIGSGIVFQSPRNGDVDPVQASKPRFITDDNLELVLTADGPMEMIGCLQNCWFAGSSASKLVLHRDTRTADDRYYYGLIGQYGNEWYRTGEQSLTLSDTEQEDQMFSIMALRHPEGESWMYRWGILQDYIVAIGKIDSAQVARVDLIYNTGEVSSVWPDGGYFVDFTAANTLCEAHLVDYQGEVVESLEAGGWPGIVNTGAGDLDPTCN